MRKGEYENQKGFTLVEMLVTTSIILILLGISVYSFGCALGNSEYYMVKEDSNKLYSKIESYSIKHEGKLPVKDKVEVGTISEEDLKIILQDLRVEYLLSDNDEVDEVVYEDLVGSSGEVKDVMYDFIYEIDFGKLGVSEEDYEEFLVLNDEGESLRGMEIFNGTLISKNVVKSCAGEWSSYRGMHRKSSVSSGLDYEIPNDYIKNPLGE